MKNKKIITYVLWGIKEGEYLEDLLLETTDKNKLEEIQKQATIEGYRTRVLKHVEGMKPNFTNTITN